MDCHFITMQLIISQDLIPHTQIKNQNIFLISQLVLQLNGVIAKK